MTRASLRCICGVIFGITLRSQLTKKLFPSILLSGFFRSVRSVAPLPSSAFYSTIRIHGEFISHVAIIIYISHNANNEIYLIHCTETCLFCLSKRLRYQESQNCSMSRAKVFLLFLENPTSQHEIKTHASLRIITGNFEPRDPKRHRRIVKQPRLSYKLSATGLMWQIPPTAKLRQIVCGPLAAIHDTVPPGKSICKSTRKS